jgi:hypothetical protein
MPGFTRSSAGTAFLSPGEANREKIAQNTVVLSEPFPIQARAVGDTSQTIQKTPKGKRTNNQSRASNNLTVSMVETLYTDSRITPKSNPVWASKRKRK